MTINLQFLCDCELVAMAGVVETLNGFAVGEGVDEAIVLVGAAAWG